MLFGCAFDASGLGSTTNITSASNSDPCSEADCPTMGLCELVDGDAQCMCNDDAPPDTATCGDETSTGTGDETDFSGGMSETGDSTTVGITTEIMTTDEPTSDGGTDDSTTDDTTTDDSTTDDTGDSSTTGQPKLPDGAKCDSDGECESGYCYSEVNENFPIPTEQSCHPMCIQPGDQQMWCFESDDCCTGFCNPLNGFCIS